MGESVPVAVFLGLGVSLDCIFWIPAHLLVGKEQYKTKKTIYSLVTPTGLLMFDLSRCGKNIFSDVMWNSHVKSQTDILVYAVD